MWLYATTPLFASPHLLCIYTTLSVNTPILITPSQLLMQACAQEIFIVLSSYFPISFPQSSGGPPRGVTSEVFLSNIHKNTFYLLLLTCCHLFT